jgi:hypothetical protein
MSYHQQNGQVILTMSREDYDWLLFRLGKATNYPGRPKVAGRTLRQDKEFLNRLHEGNPDYVAFDLDSDPSLDETTKEKTP